MLLQISQATTGYQIPDDTILEIFDTPPFPYLSVIPFSEKVLMMEYENSQTLADLSEPTVKLAGVEISKRLFGEKERYPTTKMKLYNTKTGNISISIFLKN